MQYDIAHAKALGWRQLRAKQAKRERKAEERRRKAKSAKKAKSVEHASTDGGEDDQSSENPDSEDEDWNAICAVGLKVFSHDPRLELEVKPSAELNHLLNETPENNTLGDSKSK